MADDSYRSNRGRDSWPRGEAGPPARPSASDPLAELARLIGQNDPYAERNRPDAYDQGRAEGYATDDYATDQYADTGLDWAAGGDYGAQHDRGAEGYGPPPPPAASYSTSAYPPSASAYAAQDRDYESEARVGARYFSGPAAKFNGFGGREDAYREDAYDEQAPAPPPPPGSSSAFVPPAPSGRYAPDEAGYDGEETYGADHYYDEPPRSSPRTGLVVVMAVLGLVVIGTAGAFAYRAMFGSPVFLGLPPIIKAMNGPNKILPSYGDTQANNASQAGASGGASKEKLVSREEAPVAIEPPKPAPRVVSTIPIVPTQTPPASVAPAPAPETPSATASSAAAVPMSNGSPPPTVSPAASPAGDAPSQPPASATGTAPPSSPVTAPPASTEPKKVHTVVIRSDQSGNMDTQSAQPAPASQTAAPPATRPVPAPRNTARTAPPPKSTTPPANAPMSIVPGSEGEAATSAPAPTPPRARMASNEPVENNAATAPSGGGYAVQVTSQHNEADAQASFKELQAKFPQQLGGRAPIIRRADLGAKGVYYRALVGPFASAEEAASVCSSLKAAGGNCLVQRN